MEMVKNLNIFVERKLPTT